MVRRDTAKRDTGGGAPVVWAGSGRLRATRWRGEPTIAHVVPTGTVAPTPEAVRRCVDDLAREGYRSVLTAALADAEQAPFLAAGFGVHQELHLLERPVRDLPPLGSTPLRRAKRGDHPAVLAVDAAAFPPFWRLDDAGLQDAVGATPAARIRVAETGGRDDRRVVGYAVVGRAGPRGYVQRLAVDPAHQRTGIATDLMVDGLRWLRRWGAHDVLVNTQVGNESALRLYEQLGFRARPGGLAVLRLDIDALDQRAPESRG